MRMGRLSLKVGALGKEREQLNEMSYREENIKKYAKVGGKKAKIR
jgi:hypothetical protein